MSNVDAGLPAPSEPGAFLITASIEINAPVEKAWSVLTDFPAYGEWNPFSRSLTFTNESKEPDANQSQPLAPGKRLLMKCNVPPTMAEGVKPRIEPFILVLSADHAHHRVCWKNTAFPSWLLRGERWQVLQALGPNRTAYTTQEVFAGPVGYYVRWFLGVDLRRGFEAMAEALKTRCE